MIEVRDLVYEYPTNRALHGVSFTIAPGTITALVGPNGAGKTTLLRCLAALEPPYSGSVRIDGIDTRDDPRRIHELLGYLPDFFGLYEDLTVWRALYFAARSHALPEERARSAVVETAKAVSLTDRLEAKASELSRGLRQRLAIGQSIVHRPKVLLLDEPASGLDPESRRNLSQLLTALKDQGLTLIVSSHILAELDDYATEMLIIKDGRIAGAQSVSSAPGEEKVGIRIALTAADERLAAWLGAQAGVEVQKNDGDSVSIGMTGDKHAHAALLRRLIEANFSVCDFSVHKQRLEDRYFAETKQG